MLEPDDRKCQIDDLTIFMSLSEEIFKDLKGYGFDAQIKEYIDLAIVHQNKCHAYLLLSRMILEGTIIKNEGFMP